MDYLVIWDTDGDTCNVALSDEPQIDTAVTEWLRSGGTHDSVLHLTTCGGATFKCLASHITSWMVTTPAIRRRNIELQKQMEDEETAIKHELGIWEE